MMRVARFRAPRVPRGLLVLAQVVALLAVLLGDRAVGAQAPESGAEAARRSLLLQAESARTAGDHAHALDLASRAGAIRMTPSLALMLAQEENALGRLPAALEHARRCEVDATADSSLRNRDRILRLCTALVHDLGERVVTPSEPTRATASIASPAAPSLLPSQAMPPDQRAPTRAPRELPHAARTNGAGPGPWIVAGAGALAFGAAGFLWAFHLDAIADRDDACTPRGCYPSSITENERARNFTMATNVTLAAGGVLVAAGMTWFVVSRVLGSRGAIAAVHPVAWATPQAAGAGIGGSL